MSRSGGAWPAGVALAVLFSSCVVPACSNAAGDSIPNPRTAAPSMDRATTSPHASPISDATMDHVTLFRGAGGPMASIRDRSHTMLADSGTRANAAAEKALTSADGSLRRGAAAHLARHGTATSAAAVIRALTESRDDHAFRAELIAALGHVGTPECMQLLVDVIESTSTREASLAGRQLADSDAEFPRESLRAAAGMGNPAHTRAAALTALGPGATGDEAEVFRAGAVDFAAPVRAAAVDGLARMPDVTRAEMSALIDDESGSVRFATLHALRITEAPWVASVAARALADHDDDIQRTAVQTIAARPDSRSYEVLLAILTNRGQEDYVRGEAARGLLSIDPTRGVGALEMVASAESGGTGLDCRDALEQLPHADR